MRILFLATRFPRPPFKGDQARAFHQLRLLSQKHDVTLITFGERSLDSAALRTIESFCKRVVVIPRSRSRFLNLLRAPFTRLPLQTLLYSSRAYARAVDREVSSGDYDLVHVQLIRMCPYAEGVVLPRVADFIDAVSMNMERRAATESLLLRPLVRFEMRRVLDYEKKVCMTLDEVVVVSLRDRAALSECPRMHVVPIGVEPEALRVHPVAREADLIVFTGTMNYSPNVDAAEYLVHDIFPLIRKAHPAARIQIVGANPTRAVRRLMRVSGVEVTGFVPSVFPYLQRAAVSVCPIRFGSRIQFKLLEAMAVCTPVVATLGVGGLDAENGVHLLVGSDAAEIAENVNRVLSDPDLATRIGRAGAELVRSKYTWEASVASLERIYESAVRGKRR